jgi:aminoglycoside phosphotransferase (APT) family kinase protein
MELIAEGRDAEVFDAGPGRVLRRYRDAARDSAVEAEVMRYVARSGFPVPAVYDADGPDLVLERIDGLTMLETLGSRPWRLRAYAHVLADLHTRLGRIAAPPGLRHPLGAGDDLLHLDLHPGNVLLSPRGPVVIDWTNASAGPAAGDVADTWLLLACARPDEGDRLVAAAQGLYARMFLTRAGRESAVTHLHDALAHRVGDHNMTPAEVRRMRALVRRETGREAA